jgi:chloramphenicol-sensitive protein RarD
VVFGLSAYVLWGLLTIYWKALGNFPALELIGWRVLASVGILVVVLGATGRLRTLRARTSDPALRWRIVAAALLLSVNWTAYVYAVVADHVIETALGYFMAPIGTMLLGVFVLHERLRRAQQAALVLAVAAVGVLTFSYGQVPVIALLLAVTWSLYGLLKKQVPLSALEGLASETFVLVVPAAALVVWGSSRADSVINTATAGQWILLALSGVVTTVPLVLFAGAARRVPLTILGPMQYSVPTINFLLGWLVYGENLPPARVAGFALVWVGLVVPTFDSVHRSRSNRVPVATVQGT